MALYWQPDSQLFLPVLDGANQLMTVITDASQTVKCLEGRRSVAHICIDSCGVYLHLGDVWCRLQEAITSVKIRALLV